MGRDSGPIFFWREESRCTRFTRASLFDGIKNYDDAGKEGFDPRIDLFGTAGSRLLSLLLDGGRAQGKKGALFGFAKPSKEIDRGWQTLKNNNQQIQK